MRYYAFGSIYWHPEVGAFEVHGAIRSRWAKLGWEKSFLANASKSASEVLSAISAIIVPVLIKPIDGRNVYLTSGPALGGPEPLGTLSNLLSLTTDYRFDGANVRNRWYKVRTGFAIEVEGSADIAITLDLQIEVFLDKVQHKVFASPRKWWAHVHVPWPTSWGISANEVLEKLRPVVSAEMNRLHEVAALPNGLNFLSLKVMPDGALNFFIEPLG